MTAIYPVSRRFPAAKQLQTLVLSIQKPNFSQQNVVLTENLCGELLDKNPDIKYLKKLHSRICIDHDLHSKSSIAIKLMRAYAACGEFVSTRHIFDKSPEKDVVFFNVMIISYVNNRLYGNGLYVFKSTAGHGTNPDHYTYSCVLKASSGLEDLLVGLQIHAAVVKSWVWLEYVCGEWVNFHVWEMRLLGGGCQSS